METIHLFEETPATLSEKLKQAYDFWEPRRRIWFNVLVALPGLLSLYVARGPLSTNLPGAACWGLVANGLYSLGYVLDSRLIVASNGNRSLGRLRHFLFWIGTLAYMGLTAAVGFFYLMVTSMD